MTGSPCSGPSRKKILHSLTGSVLRLALPHMVQDLPALHLHRKEFKNESSESKSVFCADREKETRTPVPGDKIRGGAAAALLVASLTSIKEAEVCSEWTQADLRVSCVLGQSVLGILCLQVVPELCGIKVCLCFWLGWGSCS